MVLFRARVRSGLALAALFWAGCGGAQAGTVAPEPGDPSAPPDFTSLPSSQDVMLTERMQFGWILAEESLAIDPPALPRRRDAQSVFSWAENELKRWLRRKQQTLEAARGELDVAAEQSHPQRILAGAIVGLLYEDVSRTLMGVPAPEELTRDPEILVIYREVIDAHAAPFLEHARRAYRACALNARGQEVFRDWGMYCAAREERLPAPLRASPVPVGQTEVTVTQDY